VSGDSAGASRAWLDERKRKYEIRDQGAGFGHTPAGVDCDRAPRTIDGSPTCRRRYPQSRGRPWDEAGHPCRFISTWGSQGRFQVDAWNVVRGSARFCICWAVRGARFGLRVLPLGSGASRDPLHPLGVGPSLLLAVFFTLATFGPGGRLTWVQTGGRKGPAQAEASDQTVRATTRDSQVARRGPAMLGACRVESRRSSPCRVGLKGEGAR